MEKAQQVARVVAVNDDVLSIETTGIRGLMKNEVVYVCSKDTRGETVKLKAEILRVKGNRADIQVYEDTRGVAVGDPIEGSGEMLSIALGPGLLGQVYDGLQNPLHNIADAHGFFLPRGVTYPATDPAKKWAFTPTRKVGDKVQAGDVLGTVPEGRYTIKIMAPFNLRGEAKVSWIQEGTFTPDTVVARLETHDETKDITMIQTWPVRRPIPARMLEQYKTERLFPETPLMTGQRIVDTFFPVAEGGTACVPGPFGAGKTVLQHLLAKYAAVDIVIVVACGERAGEVVETIVEFPELKDPQTEGSLMDRTIIICNTSSMPVAAREASIYTGLTLGEFYRQMGYRVLVLADSTSRWAQALRETSGRLEEIPGEEAFPAYLDSSIRGLYERAGKFRNNDGSEGSLSIVGAVSPAGGNFEEPVTQATLRTVKCFLGLSYDRAYKRFFPAIDPLISWSRYHGQLSKWYDSNLAKGWSDKVAAAQSLLDQGDKIGKMMQVTGEEGISTEDFVVFQKALFVDMVFLQQDAFDKVDVACPMQRQKESFMLLSELVEEDYSFPDKETARRFFTRLTGLYKNLNYAVHGSAEYHQYMDEIKSLAAEHLAKGLPEAA
ncbi:MAG: V-type ATP synthase subunit A [Alphaproteobacteria bacterium]|nr:V-type ATP synthase subunit A [Alphaproteobacteria bacterium]